MTQTACDTLCARLAEYDRLVEVGIGHRFDLARTLADAGVDVTATDRIARETPPNVAFVRDDITAPEMERYADADALYARNLPPELHRPTLAVARDTDADFLFTTLGGDAPTVPATLETFSEGPERTIYHAHVTGPARTRYERGQRGSGGHVIPRRDATTGRGR